MNYVMKQIEIEGIDPEPRIQAAHTPEGAYIGDEDWAKELARRGILPELRDGCSVCSIGFCEAEQKWYGWSHRAIFGFGIGSTVSKGDCAYVAPSRDDFLEQQRNFWHDAEYHAETFVREAERDGVKGALVFWIYNDQVPNEALRGQPGEHFSPYDAVGRGEWTAQTLEDAKQMACDFAEGVS